MRERKSMSIISYRPPHHHCLAVRSSSAVRTTRGSISSGARAAAATLPCAAIEGHYLGMLVDVAVLSERLAEPCRA
jgi:hypothetical protein